ALPPGPCAGSPSDLTAPTLRKTATLGPSGRAVWTLNLPAAACTQLVELFDLSSCTSTPAVPLIDPDADRDGHLAIPRGGDDCDDADPEVYPGHIEVPLNGIDDDCDATTPDDAPDCTYVDDPTLSAGEPAELAGVTAWHNELRALAGVPPLRWDAHLARTAQAWADGCSFTFDPNRSPDAGFSYVGEQWSWGSPARSWETNPLGLVAGWSDERFNCDTTLPIGTVNPNPCGHYSQMVWDTTTAVGCGVRSCAALDRRWLVCNYGPGGNYMGQTPYDTAVGQCLDQDSDGYYQWQDRFDRDASTH
ncbi:MAG TPA: CAP domain-containing protein, partial [Myxococcota bacterium]|nr:CAP domain-containing protein [Myxococcota bacterium]